jgi:HTH-type transcriptional regulator, glycine betaine synthesis regulator
VREADARAPRAAPGPLARAELRAADAVGSLMELWGFRRQLGRVWTVLFLSERPLAAPELCERLQISTGLLSMSLAELRRWGAVRGVELPGDRKEHFEAEANVWSLVRRVLAERERGAVENALRELAGAAQGLGEAIASSAGNPRLRAAARFRADRLQALLDLCRVGLGILEALVQAGRADAGPLKALSELLSRREGRGSSAPGATGTR